jgi:flavin-dependent dehydrogenase
MRRDVVIVGAGINGNLAASYLKLKQPELDIVVFDKGQQKLPLIGESLTEYSTHFLRTLGLGQHLEDEHYHKYGLTFYFKDQLEDPTDRTYSVHEAPAIPPMHTALINRYVFDEELRSRNEQAGVEYLQASATSIQHCGDGFSIETKTKNGDQTSTGSIDAKWIVDCSGRSRFLTQQLGLKVPYTAPQRSSYWFRLVDFDPDRLGRLEAIKEQQSSFDSYYTTHHFMGRNNWAWCIPMRPHGDYTNLISLGVVWRPDISDLKINSVESYNDYFRNEHPVLSELVESGTFLDEGLYRNYMFENSKVYSEKGWFIVGDAADTVDPLYSTGLVLSSLQITQVEKMISDAKHGKLTETQVHDLECAYKNTRETMQNEVSGFYEIVHDPWQCHWRMYISSLIYFHLMLPAWLAGYMTDPKGARWISRFLGVAKSNTASLTRILKLSADNPRNGTARDLKNKYVQTINWNLHRGNESELPKHLSTMLMRLAKYRFLFWKRSGFKDVRRQLQSLTSEIAGSILFGSVLRWVRLRNLAGRQTMRSSEEMRD